MPGQPVIHDIPGLWIGHASDAEALTGCTVVLTPDGAVGGVDVRGSAPGTRETDLLDPINLVDRVHAILLAGGSAFGLDAATGVMRWLEERGHGLETGVARVPIVPAAVLFDLGLGRADRRPDAAMGYAACEDAMAEDSPRTARVVAEGNVGAGAGASVGKLLGPAMATKTGLGTACLAGPGGLLVGAVIAVNAFGDVRDPSSGAILAGTRNPAGGFLDTTAVLTGQPPGMAGQPPAFSSDSGGSAGQSAGQNTTIGVVVTNAAFGKTGARKVAQMAHDGLALTISPVHTMYDGDTLFAISCGPDESKVQADLSAVGTLAARAVAGAVIRAALAAVAAGGLPASADIAG